MSKAVELAKLILREAGYVVTPNRGDDASIVEDVLRSDTRRDVYLTSDGKFGITYGGGLVSPDVVKQMVAENRLVLRWPDKPNLQCYVLAK